MPAFDHDALSGAFDFARRRVEAGEIPFTVLAVGGAQGEVRTDAYWPANGTDNPGAGAVCLLASITKPIFGTMVARLASEGRFSLVEPLNRWLPELDAAGLAPFSAWHVLTHTTGLHDINLEGLLMSGGSRKQMLEATIASGQKSAPGAAFHYTSFTFDLLAEALVRALDRPFEELLAETVLAPLGMHETAFEPSDALRAAGRVAPVKLGSLDGTRNPEADAVPDDVAVRAFSALHLAGGGLWSTAHDLLRFGRAWLRGGELDGVRLLGRPIVDLWTRELQIPLFAPVADPLAADHYAIGWGKPGPATPATPGAFGHGGVSGTRLWIDPAHDLVFVFLSGAWGTISPRIDEQLLAVYAALEP